VSSTTFSLVVNRTGSLTLGNVISGTGTFQQAGSGTTILTGANTFSGATTVSAGTLQVGNGGTAGSLGSGSITNDAVLAFRRSDAVVVANPITGSGSVVQEGSGSLTLNATNTYSGGTTITAGTLTAASNAALGTGAVTLTGGDLRMANGTAFSNAFTLSGSAANTRLGSVLAVDYLVVGGGGGAGTGGGGGMGGAGSNGGGGSGIGGAGVQSSITGSAVWCAGGGSGASATGTADGGGNGSFGGGGNAGTAGGSGVVVLRYLGDPVATGGTITAGTGSAEGYTLHTFPVGSSSFALDMAAIQATLSGDISGTGGFTFDTPSTLVLTGANTYAGDTIISTGVLQVGAGGGTGSLGSGNVSNSAALVFNRDNALAVANVISGTGSLTQAGSGTLTLSGANTYSGGTTIAAGTLLEFSDLAAQAQAFVEDTTVFAMINYTGAWDGGFFTSNGQTLADGSRFFVGSQQWEIDYAATSGGLNFTDDYVSGSFVTITAVPEPATLALAAAASLGLAALTRRGGARGPGFANPIRSRRYTDPEKLWPRVASFHNGSRSRCCVEDSS
jgi:fibronectin-binding autotransporter adhesin